MRTTTTIMTALLAMALLAGCAVRSGDPAVYGTAEGGTLVPGQIRQAGSSTVYPLAELWAADFGGVRDVQFTVEGGGSGAGASKLCAKEIDLGDLSRTMKDPERTECASRGVAPTEWKVAFDGLSVVVSNRNTFVQDLTTQQLASIFRKDDPVTNWRAIDPSFPDQAVKLCYPDADSGTYEYFNEAILGHGQPRTGGNVQQSSDDNVLVTCVAREPYAIGYFGYAYFIENEDQVRAIQVEGVAPTPQTIRDGTYAPLSRPIYIYTNGVPTGLLADYFRYAFHDEGGMQLVPEAGYVPLDEATVAQQLAMLG